jgi:glyoxylase-like metal-dependent hydrolase (beta-lactamase superfamily II)
MSGKTEYPGARFRHEDDEEWREVRAIERGGKRVSVWEKWVEIGPNAMCIIGRYDPGMMVHKHGHNSHHIVYVMDGVLNVGDVVCTKGMHVTLDQGAAFGPLEAGPEGCLLYEVMMGDPRSWAADAEGFQDFLKSRGATALPHPPIVWPEKRAT